jgi:hypothetical protein
MNDDCGHRCCHIRSNGYHVHASEPCDCDRCDSGVWPRVAFLTGQLVGPGPTPPRPLTRSAR